MRVHEDAARSMRIPINYRNCCNINCILVNTSLYSRIRGKSATVTVLCSVLAQMQAMMLVCLEQLFGSYEDTRGAAHGFCKHIASSISDRGHSVAAHGFRNRGSHSMVGIAIA